MVEILILVLSVPNNAFKVFGPSLTIFCLSQVCSADGNDLSLYPDTTFGLLKLFRKAMNYILAIL